MITNDQIEIYLQNSIIYSIYGDATITEIDQINKLIHLNICIGPLKNQ